MKVFGQVLRSCIGRLVNLRDTQALRLIASIPLIQWREKCCSCEGKSAFTQWFFPIYIRSLKDQARKSKYPRTQILEPRTQPKLICYSSTTFIPTRSNNLIEVTSQSYIASHRKLYRNQSKAIQLSSLSYIGSPSDQYRFTQSSLVDGKISLHLRGDDLPLSMCYQP